MKQIFLSSSWIGEDDIQVFTIGPFFTNPFTIFFLKYTSILHIVIIGLYWNFKLVQLSPVFIDPDTNSLQFPYLHKTALVASMVAIW